MKDYHFKVFSSVQSLSRVWLFATPWIAAHQASLSITNSWSLLKLRPFQGVTIIKSLSEILIFFQYTTLLN